MKHEKEVYVYAETDHYVSEGWTIFSQVQTERQRTMKIQRKSLIALFAATISAFGLVAPPSAACDNPYDVQVVYIVPHGETADAAGVLADVLTAQTLMRKEMARHGFGDDRTFKIAEFTTFKGDATSKWTTEAFETASVNDLWEDWLKYNLPPYRSGVERLHRVYLFIVEGATKITPVACGLASMFVGDGWAASPFIGGWAFVGADTPCDDRSALLAHEIGHTFGLKHNLDPATTMHKGSEHVVQRQFSEAECEWLDGSRYFDDDHSDANDLPGIQLLSAQAAQLAGEPSVEIAFRVTSHVGVRMFQLYRQSDGAAVAMETMNTWQTTIQVNIQRTLLAGETGLGAMVMDAKGAVGRDSYLFGIPPIRPPAQNNAIARVGTEAVMWANLKR